MALMLRRKTKNRARGQIRKLFAGQLLTGVILVMAILLVAAIVWYGTRLEAFNIISVEVSGGETIDHEMVRSAVEEELDGEYYHIVPRSFEWTYPQAKIINKVKSLPRVSGVVIDTSESGVLRVNLSEYEPFALWCEGDENGGVKAPCVFVDYEGQAFAPAPNLSGTSLLRYRNTDTPSEGTKPFGATFLKETKFFATEVNKRFGLPIGVVEWIGQEDVSYYVRGGGILKTTLRQPVSDTLDNLSVILGSKEFEHIAPGNFDYIDLRFGDKVFVNEGKTEVEETINAASSSVEAAF